jgi:short-chain 2-methylacyl-CoA dehydrogenase
VSSFDLSAEQEDFRRVVHDFAAKEIAPHVAQWNRDHYFPAGVVRQMASSG